MEGDLKTYGQAIYKTMLLIVKYHVICILNYCKCGFICEIFNFV